MSNDSCLCADRETLINRIERALEGKAASVSTEFPTPKEHRPYTCEHEGCCRPGYASGLCNMHYLRKRRGACMDAPTRSFKAGGRCSVCEKVTSKGGWGMCPTHYRRERVRVIKSEIVSAFGGCCVRCKNSFPLCVYDFHHVDRREKKRTADLINNVPVEEIVDEILKCELLCANCHRIEHYNG